MVDEFDLDSLSSRLYDCNAELDKVDEAVWDLKPSRPANFIAIIE